MLDQQEEDGHRQGLTRRLPGHTDAAAKGSIQYHRTMDPECPFCQIGRGEQPARIVGDSPDALAFFPLRPVCPGHTIVIPKTHIRDLWAGGVPACRGADADGGPHRAGHLQRAAA